MLLSSHGILASGGTQFVDETSFFFDGVDETIQNPSGLANQYNTIQADAGSGANVKWSVSFWVKCDTLSSNHTLYYISDSTGTLIQYLIVQSSGKLQAFLSGSGSNWTRSATGAITTGSWFHVAMVYNGTLNRYSRQKIYVNGSTSGSTSNFYSANHGQSANIYLGSRAGTASYLNANINEFAVFYGTALTTAEVVTLYNNGQATNLNDFTTPPVNWYRSENATWNGTIWTMPDVNATGPNIESVNMQQTSLKNDVP